MQELSIEQIQASYFNEQALRLPSYQMYRMNTPTGRYYYTLIQGEPKFYISVTHLLSRFTPASPHLMKWIAQHGEEGAERIRNRRAAYGTLMHITIEQMIINKGIDLDNLPAAVHQYFQVEETWGAKESEFLRELEKDVMAFAQFMIDKQVEPIAVEPILKCDRFSTAGAIDLFCKLRFNGQKVYAIVDFKGSKKGFYEDNELQLEYYKHAILEEWPEFKDQDIMLFNWAGTDWKTKPGYKLTNQTGKHPVEELKLYADLYRIKTQKNPIQSTRIFEFSGHLDLLKGDLSENYSIITLNQKISDHEPNQEQIIPTKDPLADRRQDQGWRETEEQPGQGIPGQPRLL